MRNEPSGESVARMRSLLLMFMPHKNGRRPVAAAALAVYLSAVFGLPIPVLGPRPSGVKFPCQGHGCGCHTAEQCLKQCCCFTPAQRVAWAKSHGVDPSLCGESASMQPAEPMEPAHGDCCSSRQPEQENGGDEHQEHDGVRWTSSLAAQQCQGASSHWLFGFVAIRTSPDMRYGNDQTPSGWVTAVPDGLFFVALAPPVPPPRA